MTQKYPNDPSYALLSSISDADIITIHKSVPVDPQTAPEGFVTHHTTMGVLKGFFQSAAARYTASKYNAVAPGGHTPGNPIAVGVSADTQFATTRLAIIELTEDEVYNITLPLLADIQAGDKIVIINNGPDYLTNPASLIHNGVAINGVSEDVALNEDKICVALECFDPALGWSITNVWSHTPSLIV